MIKGAKKTVSVLLPMECYERLNTLAQESDRSVPGYIRVVLYRHLRNDCPQGDDRGGPCGNPLSQPPADSSPYTGEP